MPSRLPLSLESDVPPPADFPTGSAVLLGTSVVLAVLGGVFAGEAVSALNEQDEQLRAGENRQLLTDEFRDSQERLVVNTIASTALFSTAASSALLGVVLLLDD